jgi:hypothetical protein
MLVFYNDFWIFFATNQAQTSSNVSTVIWSRILKVYFQALQRIDTFVWQTAARRPSVRTIASNPTLDVLLSLWRVVVSYRGGGGGGARRNRTRCERFRAPTSLTRSLYSTYSFVKVDTQDQKKKSFSVVLTVYSSYIYTIPSGPLRGEGCCLFQKL